MDFEEEIQLLLSIYPIGLMTDEWNALFDLKFGWLFGMFFDFLEISMFAQLPQDGGLKIKWYKAIFQLEDSPLNGSHISREATIGWR